MSDFAWDFPLFAALDLTTDGLVGFTDGDGKWHLAIWTDEAGVREFIERAGRKLAPLILPTALAVESVLRDALSLGAASIVVDATKPDMDALARYLPFRVFACHPAMQEKSK
jgi:hypothetical protein